MARPVLWSKNTAFYPIGNSPPVCLTQSLSPEKSADILLLNCGDPRNILYTIHADLGDGNRYLDFTCCDLEPAVLARNILLFTMIVDGVAPESAWSIFFHFFLDKTSHNILVAQCKTLIKSASDTKKWKASKYGKFLRFCTEYSLLEIRRHWSLYAESENIIAHEHEAWQKSFRSCMKSIRKHKREEILAAVRATGPLCYSSIRSGQQTYKSFWTDGVTRSTSSQTSATPYINPTFAYSVAGKKFNVHSSTNPAAAFFLAPAAALKHDVPFPQTVTSEELMDCARSQFSSWCLSFKRRLSSASKANLVIRFFVGDPLAFCEALHICKEQKTTETGVYAHSWGGLPIVLDTGNYGRSSATLAPLLFNVIETSNLIDQVGVINLLVVTVPLLDRKPWSILHTNTLLDAKQVGPAKSAFSKSACADIPTLSMLLGVVPSPHLWHFTSHSNKHEYLLTHPCPTGEICESMSWRFVSSFVPNAPPTSQDTDMGHVAVLCDPEKLANFFFSIYVRMFPVEDLEDLMKRDKNAPPEYFAVHYTRASLVAFLALVKGNVKVDWPRTMDYFIKLIENDKTLLPGMNNYLDILCQMYLRNVHTYKTLTPAFLESERRPHDMFHDWKNVLVVSCVVFKIPRHSLTQLESMQSDKLMAEMLQCDIYNDSNFRHCYSSIHLTFGDIQVSIADGEPNVTIKEDPRGWEGDSALIATFYAPSWNLAFIEPTSTRISLNFYVTACSSSRQLVPQLGYGLCIFSTSLADTALVQIVRHRPNNAREIEVLRTTPAYSTGNVSPDGRDSMTLIFNPSGKRVTHLRARKDLTDSIAARSLASGSDVSVTPKTDSSLLVTFGDHALRFVYPFPIETKHLHTRIARKSSYFEIETPIRHDFNDFKDLSLNPFAVAYDKDQVNLLNVHYVNLDILPALLLPVEENHVGWLHLHASMTLSWAEKQARRPLLNQGERQGITLVDLKESIRFMLLSYVCPRRKEPERWFSNFVLIAPSIDGPNDFHTLIFFNAVKMDLASQTAVIDACVVPFAKSTWVNLKNTKGIFKNRNVHPISIYEDEKRAWNLLLPVMAERCRTWNHTTTCEYRTKGVPASVEGYNQSPLCSCGKGQNLGRFGTLSEWKDFHPEATRVAIALLFPFTFMDNVMAFVPESAENMWREMVRAQIECAQCGGPGKPKLLACAACMKARYCSQQCQKAHWKIHKTQCSPSQRTLHEFLR